MPIIIVSSRPHKLKRQFEWQLSFSFVACVYLKGWKIEPENGVQIFLWKPRNSNSMDTSLIVPQRGIDPNKDHNIASYFNRNRTWLLDIVLHYRTRTNLGTWPVPTKLRTRHRATWNTFRLSYTILKFAWRQHNVQATGILSTLSSLRNASRDFVNVWSYWGVTSTPGTRGSTCWKNMNCLTLPEYSTA